MPEPSARTLQSADFGPLAALFGEPVHGEVISADDVPEPCHGLLVHDRDMTSTLESFCGQQLRVEVLGKRVEDDRLWRRVLLVGVQDGRLVEFGAIRIELAALPEAARAEVLACETPLGAILHAHSVSFRSAPTAFFRVHGGPGLPSALRSFSRDAANTELCLYGRRNTLSLTDGRVIADIVEVLPPL